MAKRNSSPASRSLTAEDWVQAALGALLSGGVAAVAVEPLAKALGVTKGSFYWHFGNRGALLKAILARWEAQNESVIAAATALPDPRERLLRVFDAATSDQPPQWSHSAESQPFLGRGFEQALGDAADDALVGPVLRRITERRLAFLESCYRALGFSPADARHRALLTYSAYVGTLRLAREAPNRMPQGADYVAYRSHQIATLIPEPHGNDKT